MLDTAGAGNALSAERTHQLTQALWRHIEEQRPARLADSPELARVLGDGSVTRAAELRRFVAKIDELTPSDRARFAAAIDDVQVRSKLWLIDELTRVADLDGATLVVLGAWFGILPLLCNWRVQPPPSRMICIDIDEQACDLGRRVIEPLYGNVEFRVGDAMDLDYDAVAGPGSIVVNTICEHLADAPRWWTRIPSEQLTVLQSNDYDRCSDHVNCVRDLDEMKAQTPMSKTLFEGVLRLPIFHRFMLIGSR